MRTSSRHVDVGFAAHSSATGTRTRVARLRAEYPNQLADSDEVVGQGAGLPGGGWLELPFVSHPPNAEHGLVVATYSRGEHDLQCLINCRKRRRVDASRPAWSGVAIRAF